MLDFAPVLPRIRRARATTDMSRRGMPREKVLATVVSLLDKTLVPRGQRRLRQAERELRADDVAQPSSRRSQAPSCGFTSRARAARPWRLSVQAAASRAWSAARSRTCRGSTSSSIWTKRARCARSNSTAVNDYLREIAGPDVSAKDFRTWAGDRAPVLALSALGRFTIADAGQDERAPRHRGRCRKARQYADDLPQVLRPSRDRGQLYGRHAPPW